MLKNDKKTRIILKVGIALTVLSILAALITLQASSNIIETLIFQEKIVAPAIEYIDNPIEVFFTALKNSDYELIENANIFKLEGIEYSIPFDAATLSNNGWELEEGIINMSFDIENISDELLEPDETAYTTFYKTGGLEYEYITVSISNLTKRPIKVSESSVVAVSVLVDNKVDFEIANGITFNSNEADIITRLGAPDNTSADIINTAYYLYTDTRKANISINFTENNNRAAVSGLSVTVYSWEL